MDKNILLFTEIGSHLDSAVEGKLFGKPCFTLNAKAFIVFFQDEMVFKLPKEKVSQALQLEGAKLFDPSGKGRPMKEWVQLPIVHQKKWSSYAKWAHTFVDTNTK